MTAVSIPPLGHLRCDVGLHGGKEVFYYTLLGKKLHSHYCLQ